MNEYMKNRYFIIWVLVTTVATFFAGLVYMTVQQYIRHSANDPQIQMAEDWAALRPSAVKLSPAVDIGQSLSPYIVIYDAKGQPLTGSGLLHDKLPTLPSGVFTAAKKHGQNRVTWQPEKSVRQAIVVSYYGGQEPGFVVAGRSLRETEERVSQLAHQVLIVWLATLMILGLELAFFYKET